MVAEMFDWLLLPTTIHVVSRAMACTQIRCRQLSRTNLWDANASLCKRSRATEGGSCKDQVESVTVD